ncbi:MAG: bacteriohemerythrin [Treponema sp.]|jgi:hemerythrin|nr:bacteriohemerythrin [Treponema sp.]
MADELVAWSDDFLVGNSVIDRQHKELVRLTNEFWAGCQMGGVMAKVYFLQTIQGTVLYVKTHFSTEEELMRKANYPDFDAHKKQHEDFVAEVTRQIQFFEKEDNPNPSKFVEYLMNWILKHVADSDKKYMPYIAKLEQ